jgi:peptide/nickel transport system ATP-binding protein
MSVVLQVKQLSVRLPASADREFAVQDISFEVQAGKTLCVVGESGSGKSVMSLEVMGLSAKELKRSAGEMVLHLADGTHQDLHAASDQQLRQLRGRSMGMVFQEPMTALNPVMRCGDQIDELLVTHTSGNQAERKRQILEVFARVKLPEPERIFSSYPHQLSGGQRQRIVIAMAVILKPRLLICDEPTTALDVTTQKEILSLIADIQREQGAAVLFITHDMGVVAEIADDVLVMNQGKAVEIGSVDQVLRHPREAYTKMLLAAVPSMTPPAPRTIVGENDRQALLEGKGVSKTYVTRDWLGRARETHALIDSNIRLRRGETVGVVGESGSGKSTLARCLIRLIDPSAGEIFWGEGETVNEVAKVSESSLRPLRSHIQVVFQDPNRSLNPRRTVGQSICEGAMNFGATQEQALQRAHALMERVRLPIEALQRYPTQFSGGQRQRIAIARALACQPRVLVADEAVSALDVSVQAQILVLLREIQADLGLGLLFITHDLRVAAQLCDSVVVMHRGKIVEHGATADLYANPKQDYTKSLLQAAPKGIA